MDKEFVFTIIREVFGQSREGTSTQFTNGSPCDVIKSGQQPDAPTTELATVVAQPKEVPLASRQSQIDDTVMKSIVWWNSRVSAYSDSESLQKSSDCDSAYSCCSSYADAEKQVDPSDLAQRAHQVEWWNGQLRSVRDDVDDDACSVSLPLTQDSSTQSEEDAASTSSSSQSDADIDLPTTFPREDIQSEIITAPTTVISSEGASEPSFPMTRRDIPAAPRRTILDAAELSFDY